MRNRRACAGGSKKLGVYWVKDWVASDIYFCV